MLYLLTYEAVQDTTAAATEASQIELQVMHIISPQDTDETITASEGENNSQITPGQHENIKVEDQDEDDSMLFEAASSVDFIQNLEPIDTCQMTHEQDSDDGNLTINRTKKISNLSSTED